MKPQSVTVSISAELTISINEEAPDDLFSRVMTDEWSSHFYQFMTEEDIIAHWAHNAAANGVWDVSRLDGWADVPRGTVTFDIDDVFLESEPH